MRIGNWGPKGQFGQFSPWTDKDYDEVDGYGWEKSETINKLTVHGREGEAEKEEWQDIADWQKP